MVDGVVQSNGATRPDIGKQIENSVDRQFKMYNVSTTIECLQSSSLNIKLQDMIVCVCMYIQTCLLSVRFRETAPLPICVFCTGVWYEQ